MAPPAPEPAAESAPALDFDVGVGPRLVPSLLDGNQWTAGISGRGILNQQWALELGIAPRIRSQATLTGHADIALARASEEGLYDFVYPIEREILAAHLRAELAPWRRPTGEHVGFFLALTVGAEAKLARLDVATLLAPIEEGEERWYVGPSIGAIAELWFTPAIGLQGGWTERMWFQPGRTYTAGLVKDIEPVLSPDVVLLVRVRP